MLGRSLLMKASGARVLYPGYVQVLLDRITAADVGAGNTQGLEVGVTDAISTCVQALVADGILGVSGGVLSQAASLIKASCFMQGARTLSGALVPLAADMPAPTNFNFVAGDYNRRTGLGDPNNVGKYLNANRLSNADPQNDFLMAVDVHTAPSGTGAKAYIGEGTGTTGATHIGVSVGVELFRRCRSSVGTTTPNASASVGFIGVSRSTAASYLYRDNQVSQTATTASEAAQANNHFIFARNSAGTANSISNARLKFYGIGRNSNMAALDARITALSNAIQAAIPA